MHERALRVVLAVAMAAALAIFFIDPRPAGNPADERALEQLCEQALDSNSPARFAVWHAAHEQLLRLDPNRATAAAPFVRSGLFHWYELGDADRHAVILAVQPLLRDDAFFGRMAQPLFQLTGDFALLRRANPGSENAMTELMSMAVTNGLFNDYRLLREQLRRRRFITFEATRKSATPAELIALVPLPATAADQALLQGILEQLHVRPIDNNHLDTRRLDALLEYALDHNLQPLDGLDALVHIANAVSDPQRARLAVRIGQLDRASDVETESAVIDRNQWHRYYVERAVAEMQRHESLHALQYLQKAGDGVDTLVATEQIQRMAGNTSEAAAVHGTLLAHANSVQQWLGLCGSDVCDRANGTLWSAGAPFALTLAAVQSDSVPAYAEVYADDALAIEGAVSPSLLMRGALLRGLHRIDIRLVNPLTRNAIHRRIRIE